MRGRSWCCVSSMICSLLCICSCSVTNTTLIGLSYSESVISGVQLVVDGMLELLVLATCLYSC